MDLNQSYYIQVMRDHLLERQMANPSYSLRAFARDVNIHPSTLSLILKGKRAFSFKDAQGVQKKLNLPATELTKFMGSVMRAKASIDDIKIPSFDERHIIDDTHFQVIAEWEHYTVLELFELEGFQCTESEIALRLNIPMERAKEVTDNLVTAGLLSLLNGQYKKVHEDIKTTEDVSSLALRASHEETLRMGVDKINSVPVELRDFSSATLAIDLEKLPEAKNIIREFRMKMRSLLESGNKTDVYQLAIQFYPLTGDHTEIGEIQ